MILKLLLLIALYDIAQAHPSYLKKAPNLKDTYFRQFGVGAVGHTGGVSGAKLNAFGKEFKGDDCAVTDDDDDDDDDHGHGWTLKVCCADSDHDGLTNGEELGDPCCEWKEGREAPWENFQVSHPALQSERTTDRRVCNGTSTHKKPPTFYCHLQPSPSPPTPSPPGPTPKDNCHTELNSTDPLYQPAEAVCQKLTNEKDCDAKSKSSAECMWKPDYHCPTCPTDHPYSCTDCNSTPCCTSNSQNQCDHCPCHHTCPSPESTPFPPKLTPSPPKPEEAACHTQLKVFDLLHASAEEHCLEFEYETDCAKEVGTAKCEWVSNAVGTTSNTVYVQGANARLLLEEAGWEETPSIKKARLVWVRNRCVLGNYSGTSVQAVNRMPYDKIISDKAELSKMLSALPAEDRDFFPESLPLTTKEDAELVNMRFRVASKDDVWILKPAGMSKGIGVAPLPNPTDWALKGGPQRTVDSGIPHVVQRYLKRPLLLDGYKSEVRVYFLVASLDPLRVLWYKEGSVRLAAAPYVAGEWNNTLVHIINTAAGKRELGAEGYAELVAAAPRKWSFTETNEHLSQKTNNATIWDAITQQMKRAVKIAIRTAAPRMHTNPDAIADGGLMGDAWHTFALFGADFLIDADMKAWLTEIQEGTGLSHVSERVKEDFVPAMVTQTAQIGVEAASRLAHGETLEGIEANTRFELLL